MKTFSFCLIFLILLIFLQVDFLKEEKFAEYKSNETKSLRISFLNKSVKIFKDAFVYFKWKIGKKIEENKNELFLEIKIFSKNRNLNLSNEIFINLKNGKIWLKNGTEIGVTLLFLTLKIEEIQEIRNVGLIRGFNLQFIGEEKREIKNFGIQTVISTKLTSYSPEIFEKFNILGVATKAEYDKDARILVYMESYFFEPSFISMNILGISVDLLIFNTNVNLGPSENSFPFIETLILLTVFVFTFLLIFYIKRKRLSKRMD